MLYVKEIIDHKIGDRTPFKKVADHLGWTLTIAKEDTETAYDGSLWEKGYAPAEPEKTYEEKRLAEYPSMSDQLDMLYWDKVNGTNVWQETLAEIKSKYPKE